MNTNERGTIKFYNTERMFGVIKTSQGDLFFHKSNFKQNSLLSSVNTNRYIYTVLFSRRPSTRKKGKEEAYDIEIIDITSKDVNFCNNGTNLFYSVRKLIEQTNEFDAEDKRILLANLSSFISRQLHVLIVGGCGCGKSSTINAIFNEDKAKVGNIDPETQDISVYKYDNLYLHDSPGLGESPEKDEMHKEKIVNELNKTNKDGTAFIDLVLVIVDSAIRDMSSSFELICNVVLPNMGDKNRILIALNRCDLAMSGDGWIKSKGYPLPNLVEVLKQKVESIKCRVKSAADVDVDPIYYSATYKYNISKLLSYIVKKTPTEKRVFYVDNIVKDEDTFIRNDTSNPIKKNIVEENRASEQAITQRYHKKQALTRRRRKVESISESVKPIGKNFDQLDRTTVSDDNMPRTIISENKYQNGGMETVELPENDYTAISIANDNKYIQDNTKSMQEFFAAFSLESTTVSNSNMPRTTIPENKYQSGEMEIIELSENDYTTVSIVNDNKYIQDYTRACSIIRRVRAFAQIWLHFGCGGRSLAAARQGRQAQKAAEFGQNDGCG